MAKGLRLPAASGLCGRVDSYIVDFPDVLLIDPGGRNREVEAVFGTRRTGIEIASDVEGIHYFAIQFPIGGARIVG